MTITRPVAAMLFAGSMAFAAPALAQMGPGDQGHGPGDTMHDGDHMTTETVRTTHVEHHETMGSDGDHRNATNHVYRVNRHRHCGWTWRHHRHIRYCR